MESIQTSEFVDELVSKLDIPKKKVSTVLQTYTNHLLETLESSSPESSNFLGILDIVIDNKEVRENVPLRYVSELIARKLTLPISMVNAILIEYRLMIVEKLMSGNKVTIYNIARITAKPESNRITAKVSRRFHSRGIKCNVKATLFFKLWMRSDFIDFNRFIFRNS